MNVEKIGEAIVKLCKNKPMRIQMGLNGLERVKALYGKREFIESYRRIYQEMGVRSEWPVSVSN
ncbi:hypothetical protein D3C75_1307370 [compost metagenome]